MPSHYVFQSFSLNVPAVDSGGIFLVGQIYLFYCRCFRSDYLDTLVKLNEYFVDESEPEFSPEDEELFDSFGLSYDCPGYRHLFNYALAAVRGSLAGANALLQNHCKVAINWAGGWHHAKRSEAAGFCYLNDVVLAIHRLLTGLGHTADPPVSYPNEPTTQSSGRVLYIDLDLHHGDGVEEAFWYSPRVVTFSVHHASPGFYPGTGTWSPNLDQSDKVFRSGAGRGRFAAFNLPLAEGADDEIWFTAVSPVLDLLRQAVRPRYVVVQCGADCLATDPHRVFNLTLSSTNNCGDTVGSGGGGGYLLAVRQILSWDVPTLLLGGGGYQWPDTARLWTMITAVAVEAVQGVKLSLQPDIPDHCYLDLYGPDFQLEVTSLPKLTNPKGQREVIAEHHNRLLEQAVSFVNFNGLTTCNRELLIQVMQRAAERLPASFP